MPIGYVGVPLVPDPLDLVLLLSNGSSCKKKVCNEWLSYLEHIICQCNMQFHRLMGLFDRIEEMFYCSAIYSSFIVSY